MFVEKSNECLVSNSLATWGHDGAGISGLEDGLTDSFCIRIFVEFVFVMAADIGLNGSDLRTCFVW